MRVRKEKFTKELKIKKFLFKSSIILFTLAVIIFLTIIFLYSEKNKFYEEQVNNISTLINNNTNTEIVSIRSGGRIQIVR